MWSTRGARVVNRRNECFEYEKSGTFAVCDAIFFDLLRECFMSPISRALSVKRNDGELLVSFAQGSIN